MNSGTRIFKLLITDRVLLRILFCALIEVIMKINEVKIRSLKPKVPSDLKTIKSLSDVNSIIKSVDRFYDDQNKAYIELRALHSNADHDIITISGIVDMATVAEKDLEWSCDKLTNLVDRKRELIEDNRSQIEDYEFKIIPKKPTTL